MTNDTRITLLNGNLCSWDDTAGGIFHGDLGRCELLGNALVPCKQVVAEMARSKTT